MLEGLEVPLYSVDDAKRIYHLDQNSKEWHEERLRRVTASDAALVAGLSTKGNAHVALLRKFHEVPRTAAMQRGLELEAIIAENYRYHRMVSDPPLTSSRLRPLLV